MGIGILAPASLVSANAIVTTILHHIQPIRFDQWKWKQYRVCTNHAIALNLFYTY